MIDWYLLLFIAFTLVILLIDKIGSHRSIYEFMNPGKELGLSGGTYSLAIQYFTGVTFLFPFILIEKGGISSFFIFASSPFIMYWLLRKLAASKEILNEIFPFHIDSTIKIKPGFLMFVGFANIASLLIQISLIAFTFRNLFHDSSYLGVILFLSFSYVLFGLGGNTGVYKIGSLLLFVILFIISFTGLTLYLRTGIGEVYERFNLHFDGVFSGSLSEYGLYFLTFLLVMAGQTFTSFYFWESVHSVKANHRVSVLKYSSFSWAALSLSFTALIIYLHAQMEAKTFLQMLELVIQANNVVSHIIVYIGITMLAIGTGHSLYSIISLFLYTRVTGRTQQMSHRTIQQAYLFGFSMMILLGMTGVQLVDSFGRWLPYFLSFFSSAAVPFFYVYINGDFQQKHFTWTVGLMSIAGCIISPAIPDIWMVGPVSAALSFFIHIVVIRIIK